MAENTKIQWATHTFNPWRGCTKIAAGCANCYADAQSKRNPGTLGIWGPNGTRVVASEAMWREPLKWQRAERDRRECCLECEDITPRCEHCGPRPRVFCASLADVFEDWPGRLIDSRGSIMHADCKGGWSDTFSDASGRWPLLTLDDVRDRLFRVIDGTPNLDWLLLTKRPENVRRMWQPMQHAHYDDMRRENVWLGTSIACQEDADRNVPELLKCRDLCAKLFLSIEPLVGPVDLRDLDNGRMQCHWNALDGSYTQEMWDGGMGIVSRSPKRVDWVIVGGESGPHARPCNVEWIRSIVRQCHDAGVPCFVKQLGARAVFANDVSSFTGSKAPDVRGPSLGLRDPKGGDPAEWPEDIRVREVPQ